MGDTLADPRIGGFDVKSVMDGTAYELRVALEDFLADSDTGDLLLVYLSCHGLLDARKLARHATTGQPLLERWLADAHASAWPARSSSSMRRTRTTST